MRTAHGSVHCATHHLISPKHEKTEQPHPPMNDEAFFFLSALARLLWNDPTFSDQKKEDFLSVPPSKLFRGD